MSRNVYADSVRLREDELTDIPWIEIGTSPRDWYEVNRASLEMPMVRIVAGLRPYDPAVPFKSRSGVYFLFDGDCLVYIGLSTNVCKRLSEHARYERIPFDRFSFVEAPSAVLLALEEFYIDREQPPGNTKGRGRA